MPPKFKNDANTDANVLKTELAYLAGIIDGEGCITLWPVERKDRPKGRHLCRVTFTNKDNGILNECRNILNKLNVYFTQTLRKNCGCTTVEINRALEAKFLLEKLLPYLKSYKLQRAQDFIKYIDNSQYDKLGRKCNRRKRRA